jgi:DNA-binding CsgD family transcriptional regulator
MYDDGRALILSTNPKVVEYLFAQHIPLVAPADPTIIKEQFHYFVLPQQKYMQALHDLNIYFGLGNFIDFVDNKDGYFNLYCYGSHQHDQQIVNYYLNNLPRLKHHSQQVEQYVNQNFNDLKNRLIKLPQTMLPPYQSLKKKSNSLTEKQMACLKLLTQGYTMKLIGRYLGLSPRTVESYLTNIKIKLKLSQKIELIHWYQEHHMEHFID